MLGVGVSTDAPTPRMRTNQKKSMKKKEKKIEEPVVDSPEEVVEEVVEQEEKADSKEKKAFMKMIAEYKKSNPSKYEAKKESFEKKLKAL